METVSVTFPPEVIIPDFREKQCDAVTDHWKSITEPDEYTFPTTYCELEVEEVGGDSAFVFIGHQWAPPDPLAEPITGLTLSDYRYWTIDGIFPDGFSATGIFWYNKNAYLDDGIITSTADSVIIMYRPSPAHDWQYVNFTKIGLWNIGKLYVEDLQKGQYAIAVADDTFVGMREEKKKTGLHIYPNPGEGRFRIGVDQPGTLSFYDMAGNLLETLRVEGSRDSVEWDAGPLHDGTYVVRFKSVENDLIGVERTVVLRD